MKNGSLGSGLWVNMLWLSTSAFALGVGIGLSSWLITSLRTTQTLQFFLSSLVSFTPLFVCQWSLLRYYAKTTVWWIAVSIVAMLLYTTAASLVALASGPRNLLTEVIVQLGLPILAVAGLMSSAIFGVLLGSFQWLVLRRSVTNAVWWIPANAVCFGIGTTLYREIMQILFYASEFPVPTRNTNQLLPSVVSNICGILVIASVSTGILLHLLRQANASMLNVGISDQR
jgi:hypothetical protein